MDFAAGWSAASTNAALKRLCPGYVEIPNRTLQQYRRDHLDEKTMRPLEKYERQLRDEHVLVDTVRMRSAALLVQQAQVQKAIEAQAALEAQATQAAGVKVVVSPSVGNELERLVRLSDSYDAALYRLGLLQTGQGAEVVPVGTPAPQQTINVFEIINASLEGLDGPMREKLFALLRELKAAKAAARMALTDARIAARMPDPPGGEVK